MCLRDETNALLARGEQTTTVYVAEPGAFVGVRSGRLEITLQKE